MSGIVYEDIGGIPAAQYKDGLLITTDACLLAGSVRKNGKQRVCELGAGSGVVSAMILSAGKAASCVCIDFQKDLCELARKNAEPYGDRMNVVCSDVLDYKPDTVFDAVVCNPPYFKSGGKRSVKEKDALSRHESTATVFDFAACASRVLRDGGVAYFCFTPQRLAELIRACAENRLEPKTLTNVHPAKDREACLVLLSAKKNASPGMTVTGPLIIG